MPGIGKRAERSLEAGVRIAGRGAARPVVEQHPDRGQPLEGGECGRIRGDLLNRVWRQGDAVDPQRRLIDGRRERFHPGRQMWRLSGNVELEEVVPTVERVRVKRVGVDPVGEREPFVAGAGEVLREIGAVTAGLLIGPLAGEVRRHVDLVHERDRRQRVGDGRAVMGICVGSCRAGWSPHRAAPDCSCRSDRRPRSA